MVETIEAPSVVNRFEVDLESDINLHFQYKRLVTIFNGAEKSKP